MTATTPRHRVLIVGGGAGGLALASRLGRRYRRDPSVEIDLIDRHLTHIWKPLLHEVAAGTFDSHVNEISFLAQARRCGFRFRLGELAGVDTEAQEIRLAPITDHEGGVLVDERALPYDTLVMAIGSVSNDFDVRGVAEHCLFLDTTDQAELFHEALVQAVVTNFASEDAEAPLEVVIVGAGATGVELAAQLTAVSELLGSYVGQYIAPRTVRLRIVEAAPRILPALPEYLSAATARELEKLGVELLTDEVVAEVREDAVITQSGKTLPCQLAVWAAGIRAPLQDLPMGALSLNRLQQIEVDNTLRATGDDNVFAIGDCAACRWDGDRFVPARAQAAHQMAGTVFRAVRQRVDGKPGPRPVFKYRDYGSLVSLGRYSTVGNLMGNVLKSVRIEGLVARLVYLSLYKMHQVALFGWWRTGLLSLSNAFRRSVYPAIKLH